MRIVIALDDSAYAQRVIELACKRKWTADPEFKIVHVIEPDHLLDWAGDGWQQMTRELLIRRHKFAEKLCSDARHKIENSVPGSIVHFEVREGHPRTEILRAATDWSADKILIGAHGRAAEKNTDLGSTSLAVATHSLCTVEIVRDSIPTKQLKLAASNALAQMT